MVAVESKDRLARLGFHDLESYLHAFGVRIVVMESPVKDDPARIYGKRGGKTMVSTVRQAMATLAREGVAE